MLGYLKKYFLIQMRFFFFHPNAGLFDVYVESMQPDRSGGEGLLLCHTDLRCDPGRCARPAGGCSPWPAGVADGGRCWAAEEHSYCWSRSTASASSHLKENGQSHINECLS